MKHVLSLFCVTACSLQLYAANIRVLIVDGFSNHDWRHTTQLLRQLLDRDGFAVDVTTAPPPGASAEARAAWRPDFMRYDVVMQTCNNLGTDARWPREVETNLETFVRNGGGLYVYHAGNNAFAAWPEYNRMIGLGWRSKDFGPALRIDGGRVVTIPAGQGDGTSHGARVNVVVTRLGDHPIHAGLPRQWMAADLEVYTYARGPAENVQVLSYAEDAKYHLNFPIEWVVAYGKGRVYNATFGHVWKDQSDPEGLRCAGFQTIMIRALQWLAGRQVDAAVPPDYPAANKISLRPSFLPH